MCLHSMRGELCHNKKEQLGVSALSSMKVSFDIRAAAPLTMLKVSRPRSILAKQSLLTEH